MKDKVAKVVKYCLAAALAALATQVPELGLPGGTDAIASAIVGALLLHLNKPS